MFDNLLVNEVKLLEVTTSSGNELYIFITRLQNMEAMVTLIHLPGANIKEWPLREYLVSG